MRVLDKFRGCLIGGAAGDALGYAVEFESASRIFREYGPRGITEYQLQDGLARISDDTQMTLFTANGLLNAVARKQGFIWTVGRAYREWYCTQRPHAVLDGKRECWIGAIPELNIPRAPGNTCLAALSKPELGTLMHPVNNSKGCGGVMRVAPVGLFLDEDASAADVQLLGAEAAALTHGHELGWLCAAAFAHIVHLLAYGLAKTVEEAAQASMRALPESFPEASHTGEMVRLMERALELARSNRDDLECLGELGEGWVGDEALAVALYCAAKYEDDFDRALIASVNHSGDSDSTGAICGNILGAKLGLRGIPEKYLSKLELRDVILEIADDLYSYPWSFGADFIYIPWARKYQSADYVPARD